MRADEPAARAAHKIGSTMAPFFALAVPTLLQLLATSPIPPCRKLEVCLSPGCVADRAEATMQKLRALAPPDVSIEDGKCASACGAGPVVIEPSDETNVPSVVHKRVKDDELIKLLEGGDVKISTDLIRGYELFEKGQDVSAKKDHDKAAKLYQESIDMAADVVLKSIGTAEGGGTAIPTNIQWIVEAYLGMASSKLAIFDRDGALEAARKACEISRNADPLALETMVEVCAARKDDVGELDALRKIFALPQEDDPPREIALKRRSQGFRLARLEKSVGNE